MGTTDYPVTRAVLQNIGIDPDKDVTWIAVGAGVSAGVALQRGVIDALAYFDTGFGQIDAAGIGMRMLPRPANVPLIGGLFISATANFLKDNRKTAIGFARAVNKASEFLLANPEAGARAFLKLYPETAPRGASEADAVKSILFAANRRIPLYRPPYPNTKMGFIREVRADAGCQVPRPRHQGHQADVHQRHDRRDQQLRSRQDHRPGEGV